MSEQTFLFVPGNRPERFDKAVASGADVVVLDLEDAVPLEHKMSARDTVVQWLSVGGRAAVRVNAHGTTEHDADVAALAASPGLRSVLVPMADDPGVLISTHRATGAPVIALVETARGVLAAPDLAATDGVTRLALGHLDLAADLGVDPDAATLHHARSVLVLASRAAGLPGPIDGVTTNLDADEVTDADARASRRLGFAGKLCIHPRQVPVVKNALAPAAEEIAWARRVREASAAGGGLARLDGQMVDAPVVARANAILATVGESG